MPTTTEMVKPMTDIKTTMTKVMLSSFVFRHFISEILTVMSHHIFTYENDICVSGYDGLPVKIMDNLSLDNSRKISNRPSSTASPVDNENDTSQWYDTDL